MQTILPSDRGKDRNAIGFMKWGFLLESMFTLLDDVNKWHPRWYEQMTAEP